MFSAHSQKDDEEEAPEVYYRAELSPEQRRFVLDAIRSKISPTQSAMKTSCEMAIQLAEALPGRVTDKFDWAKIEAEAERRGGDWSPAMLIADGWKPQK